MKKVKFKTIFLDAAILGEEPKRQGKVMVSYLRNGDFNDPSLTLYLTYDLIDGKFVRFSPWDWVMNALVDESEGKYTEEDIERMAQEALQKVLFCEAKVEEYSKDDSVIGRTSVE